VLRPSTGIDYCITTGMGSAEWEGELLPEVYPEDWRGAL
jgi:hypothetical protein